jgi:hypothetical protein
MLPEEARLARSFEDLPGELYNLLTRITISSRSDFEHQENFLAEV